VQRKFNYIDPMRLGLTSLLRACVAGIMRLVYVDKVSNSNDLTCEFPREFATMTF
jgi:hypothetical protein